MTLGGKRYESNCMLSCLLHTRVGVIPAGQEPSRREVHALIQKSANNAVRDGMDGLRGDVYEYGSVCVYAGEHPIPG